MQTKLLVLGAGLILGLAVGVALGRISRVEKQIVPTSAQNTPKPTVKVNEKDLVYTPPVISPDGRFMIRGLWEVTPGQTTFEILGQGQEARDQIVFTGRHLKTDPQNGKNRSGELVGAWNSQSTKFAVVWRNYLNYWEFEVGPYREEEASGVAAVASNSQEVDLGKTFEESEIEQIWWGEGKQILAEVRTKTGERQLYQLVPEIKKIELPTGTGKSVEGIYPLGVRPGVAFWQRSTEDYGDMTITLWEIAGAKTDVAFTSDWGVDSGGKILVSPDKKYICAENGASGYYGYAVVNVASGLRKFTGQEYSWCEKWQDNNTLIVREKPYYWQSTEQVFALHMQNGRKELLSHKTM